MHVCACPRNRDKNRRWITFLRSLPPLHTFLRDDGDDVGNDIQRKITLINSNERIFHVTTDAAVSAGESVTAEKQAAGFIFKTDFSRALLHVPFIFY